MKENTVFVGIRIKATDQIEFMEKKMGKVIGIIGTRRRDSQKDLKLVEEAFLSVFDEADVTICSGLCPKGGDRFAVILANKYKTKKLWYPADWETYGKSAGFKRNIYIARDSDILIACVAKDRTGGTEDTIKKFIKGKGKDNLIIV